MDDYKILVYIAIIAFGLLSKLLGKRKKMQQQERKEEDEREVTPSATFEDLLEEFQRRTSGNVEKPEHKTTFDQEEQREYALETETPDDEEIAKVFEASVRQAENTEEETSSPVFGHFKRYEEEKEDNALALEVRKLLSSPDNAAKAVVLSEIINRKY
ncbi:MAG: hypothetical protein OEX02_05955 [Cyclobacteriaceae bacterium]|nr:hypothetical protein [Cyclobacteriaceae bacterium]